MQSPINIEQKELITKHYTKFNFLNYDYPFDAQITFTNRSINIKLLPNSFGLLPTISGGGLFKVYVLTEFNFHWDSNHAVDDYRYPLEVQLIHYAKIYGDLKNAQNYKDGVAVLNTFYEISANGEPNDAIENLIQSIPLGKKKLDHPVNLLQPIIAIYFLPYKIGKFYRYNGSFTIPDFKETVIWTIFSEPAVIESSQIKNLTSTWKELTKSLDKNCREIQDINGRHVYFSML